MASIEPSVVRMPDRVISRSYPEVQSQLAGQVGRTATLGHATTCGGTMTAAVVGSTLLTLLVPAAKAKGRRALRRSAAGAQAPLIAQQQQVTEQVGDKDTAEASAESEPTPGTRFTLFPFLGEPAYRSFVTSAPGDAGFDPLGFAAEGPEKYEEMLEAEVKHGRLAMLAGIGIPASEVFHGRLADAVGLPNLLASGGRAPTTLNGGLDHPVMIAFLMVTIILVGFVEILKPRFTGVPGYYGFDPLSLSEFEPPAFLQAIWDKDNALLWVAEGEIKNGRLAMLAVTFMVYSEYSTGVPIGAPLASALKGLL